MKYVLDASVALAAARPREPSYTSAFDRVSRVLAGIDEIVVPALFPIEVASALSRTGFDAVWIDAYVEHLLDGASVVVLGPQRARKVKRVATSTKLRAADAVYVWLAGREGVPLVTLDREVLLRGTSVCDVESP